MLMTMTAKKREKKELQIATRINMPQMILEIKRLK